MTLEELRNEEQFFKYMHIGVNGYKKLRDVDLDERETFYFENAVSRYTDDPELISTILELALERRKLMLQLRDKKQSIKYSELSRDPKFVEVKEKLTKRYPNLANISAENLLDGIGNAIAHGEYNESFDFVGFYNLLFECFKVSHMSGIQYSIWKLDDERWQKLLAGVRPLSTLQVKIRYGTKSSGYGTGRHSDKTPSTYVLGLSLNDLRIISNAVSEHSVTSSNSVGLADLENTALLDNVKRSAFENITKDFNDFTESDYLDTLPKKAVALLKKYGEKVALNRACLIPQFLNDRIFSLDNVIAATEFARRRGDPRSAIEFDRYDLIFNVIANYRDVERTFSNEQMASAIYGAKIENVYSELLITELVSLLQRLEQADLLNKLIVNQSVQDVAEKLYGAGGAFKISTSEINVLKLIRNSLVHVNYIFDTLTGEVHFYGLKKQDTTRGGEIDKNDIEYRLTLTLEELEKIKDACYQVYLDELKKQIAAAISERERQQAALIAQKKAEKEREAQQKPKPKTPPPYKNPKKKKK